jgi:hypothetical protein
VAKQLRCLHKVREILPISCPRLRCVERQNLAGRVDAESPSAQVVVNGDRWSVAQSLNNAIIRFEVSLMFVSFPKSLSLAVFKPVGPVGLLNTFLFGFLASDLLSSHTTKHETYVLHPMASDFGR